MGATDIRTDQFGNIDYRLSQQLRAYRREDPPPVRVKPLPITIVIYILQIAYINTTSDHGQRIIANIIAVAFFYLLLALSPMTPPLPSKM